MSFNIRSLGIAYRKAKADLYYSSNANLAAITEYEEDLDKNLTSLLRKLKGKDETWVKEADFTGGWTVAPKAIKIQKEKISASGLVFSSPAEEWAYACKNIFNGSLNEKPSAEFRLMAKLSLDFHVISALWMLEVGDKYDANLNSSAYGNRLRRKIDGSVNKLSLGSFAPYLKNFKAWRDNGIKTMATALSENKKIIAITADVKSFYHELSPAFMLNDIFNRKFNLDLSPDQSKLHRLFIEAMLAWSKKTPLGKGLPVGLPASAVVANLALYDLDRLIETEVVPLYYGRYVDDILLVMENKQDFQSADGVWKWLFARSNDMLSWSDSEKHCVQFKTEYLTDSKICFDNEKNKIFLLAGQSGKVLLNSLSKEIKERSSEWRALPDMPDSTEDVYTDLVVASQNDGEFADSLRKTDALTMRRAAFAIKLRNFEAYDRDLPPNAWENRRHAFLMAFMQHVLVLPNFFELAIYLPRVVRLAVACEDFEWLSKVVRQLQSILENVERCCQVHIKAYKRDTSLHEDEDDMMDAATIIKKWKRQLYSSVIESATAAFPPKLSKAGKIAWQDYITKGQLDIKFPAMRDMQARHARMFSYDLAHIPFRFIMMPREMISHRGIPNKRAIIHTPHASKLLPSEIVDGIEALEASLKLNGELPNGLLFAVRPFSVAEMFVVAKDPFTEIGQYVMRQAVLAFRGYMLNDKMPAFDRKRVLQIPDGHLGGKVSIAVSSWKTQHDSWVASVTRSPDPDLERYERLNRLVNGVISRPKGARYLILPELSLPSRWFMRVAEKLFARGVSLISGVEYLHASKSRVRNQVWAALSHNGLGFPSMLIYRQDKQKPALHEEQELQRLAGLEMKPEKEWDVPPVVRHGDFKFSMVVCSELTNIAYRTALRGQVDALFVPEWNQDTETFNALIESAALDVHAFVIQCNDRNFGDSRIRAPYKDGWRRDILRVKGGDDDYCVIGEIDFHTLRRFQSSHRSTGAPFKPVPDGFEISFDRKLLPT